ncbi:OmpA family protein [Paraflavitalea sp. CAU 1676]|uniref:OmpA family protein n=1 Tax=Paraflavitalea sp. CAU 1676 TaxID=3032598 RepID=UPI0023DC7138|nr:OmpA family protein [Paraflavitalea sp. CAU 1676]MDF2191588.1 OmpA family protein [Paraflavitalea sp. CAU 1676]
MKQIISFVAIVLLCSCAASKKAKMLEAESQGLKQQIGQLQATNQKLEQSNAQMQSQLEQFKSERQANVEAFTRYKEECEAAQSRLIATQSILRNQAKTLQELEDKINTALTDFADKGVDVYYKNGYVYVSMEDNLLYKSGSSALGAEGKKALGSLAGVLNDYPNLKIVIVGNTDDAKFKKGSMDNWSLSTERANGVVRAFRDDYKIDPARLTAAGRSKYNPVADNSTAAGKAKNRRTDIILNPDIDKIWESLGN